MGSNHFLCNSLKISIISNFFCWILCQRPCWQPGWGCWDLQPPPHRAHVAGSRAPTPTPPRAAAPKTLPPCRAPQAGPGARPSAAASLQNPNPALAAKLPAQLGCRQTNSESAALDAIGCPAGCWWGAGDPRPGQAPQIPRGGQEQCLPQGCATPQPQGVTPLRDAPRIPYVHGGTAASPPHSPAATWN